MMRARLATVLTASVLLAGLAPSASACALRPIAAYFEPPPGLSAEEARKFEEEAQKKFNLEWPEMLAREEAARQVRLWDEADTVMLARIEENGTVALPPGRRTIEYARNRLRPLRWLKGQGPSDDFEIRVTSTGGCGDEPSWAALGKPVGWEFVVFVRGGAPSQETVQETLVVSDWITEPRVRAALGLPHK
jgi:hypothetical protein